jgi:hypothetical protein
MAVPVFRLLSMYRVSAFNLTENAQTIHFRNVTSAARRRLACRNETNGIASENTRKLGSA